MAESLLSLFRQLENELVAFMSTRLNCPFTARDLTQELYVKVSTMEAEREIANGKAYLFRMAANLVIDHQRHVQRHKRLLDEVEQMLHGGVVSNTPEATTMAQQELERLSAVVDDLNPTTRMIFTMNRFDGISQREIARCLGISQTAVENHIRKALNKLAAARGPH